MPAQPAGSRQQAAAAAAAAATVELGGQVEEFYLKNMGDYQQDAAGGRAKANGDATTAAASASI